MAVTQPACMIGAYLALDWGLVVFPIFLYADNDPNFKNSYLELGKSKTGETNFVSFVSLFDNFFAGCTVYLI